MFEIGDRVKHFKRGEGTIIGFSKIGSALVKFDKILSGCHYHNGGVNVVKGKRSDKSDSYFINIRDFSELEKIKESLFPNFKNYPHNKINKNYLGATNEK